MLAGRKLLLADDSVTIQKVIDLTFADEGVTVVAFGNGRDAIDHVEEIAPDVVLADVFMPEKNGYEVCRYIKENERLKHIPVMLLVGSFEPFDEAEARRVGADDILTKPFQSIRRLIDRVGALVSNRPLEEEVPTAELHKPEIKPEEPTRLSTDELRVTTADTRDLRVHSKAVAAAAEQGHSQLPAEPVEEKMETLASQESQNDDDVLLDLEEFETVNAGADDDFVLDLDFDEPIDLPPAEPSRHVPMHNAVAMPAFVEPQVSERLVGVNSQQFAFQPSDSMSGVMANSEVAYEDQVHEVAAEPAEFEETKSAVTTPISLSGRNAGFGSSSELSPEMIEVIARRAVEMLSEKVVQEIAWEVVPELAELMIKRRLDERESQPQ